MQGIAGGYLLLGLFNLGGGEIILLLALLLILCGAKKLPELARGLSSGIDKFRDALDDGAREAGRSVGGIYGKSGFQALTPDNRVAELYDPSIAQPEQQPPKKGKVRKFLLWLWRRITVWRSRCQTGAAASFVGESVRPGNESSQTSDKNTQ